MLKNPEGLKTFLTEVCNVCIKLCENCVSVLDKQQFSKYFKVRLHNITSTFMFKGTSFFLEFMKLNYEMSIKTEQL